MGIRHVAASCLALLGAIVLCGTIDAAPIDIVVDTSALAGTSVDLAFDLTASTENSVTIAPFTSDIASFDAITLTGNASGSLPASVVLGGSPSLFFNEYLQTVTLGDALTFTFDTTSLQADQAFGPDDFAFFVLLGGVPVETGGPGGALFTYDFGVDAPVLSFFTSATLPVREGVVSVAEPGVFALAVAALFATGLTLPLSRVRTRR